LFRSDNGVAGDFQAHVLLKAQAPRKRWSSPTVGTKAENAAKFFDSFKLRPAEEAPLKSSE